MFSNVGLHFQILLIDANVSNPKRKKISIPQEQQCPCLLQRRGESDLLPATPPSLCPPQQLPDRDDLRDERMWRGWEWEMGS